MNLSLDDTRRQLTGLAPNTWLGWSISAGDIDGDGKPEVISAPGAISGLMRSDLVGSDYKQSRTPRIRIQGTNAGWFWTQCIDC